MACGLGSPPSAKEINDATTAGQSLKDPNTVWRAMYKSQNYISVIKDAQSLIGSDTALRTRSPSRALRVPPFQRARSTRLPDLVELASATLLGSRSVPMRRTRMSIRLSIPLSLNLTSRSLSITMTSPWCPSTPALLGESLLLSLCCLKPSIRLTNLPSQGPWRRSHQVSEALGEGARKRQDSGETDNDGPCDTSWIHRRRRCCWQRHFRLHGQVGHQRWRFSLHLRYSVFVQRPGVH